MALLSVLFSFLFKGETADINMHGTYLVISYAVLYRIIAIAVIIIWVMYTVFPDIFLYPWLKWIHVLITIAAFAALVYKQMHFADLDGTPRRYYAFNEIRQQKPEATLLPHIIIIAAFLLGQLLFIINFVVGISQKLRLLLIYYRQNNL